MAAPGQIGSDDKLAALVGAREWYHTIELAPGLLTPGWFDCRPVADSVLPSGCEGLRCLDVGTFDGFWAFEMERRGGDDVTGVDILDESRWDWPARPDPDSIAGITRRKGAGDGFLIAREQLGSSVRRLDLSVYDLDPEEHGRFDLIYMGSLLLHLRDPVRALERVRSVCRGRLVVADAIKLSLEAFRSPVARLDARGRPYWWKPNARGLARLVTAAGFEIESGPKLFLMPPGAGMPRVSIGPRTLRLREGRELLLSSRLGDPHARLTAVPATA